MHLDRINKSYDETQILKEASSRIERGDKIALIGANGKGKSTLLRIIDQSETIQGGKREEGYNVIKAFYAQHQLEALNVENEILDELKQAGSGKTEQELRNVLGCFLFSGDDVYKKIKVLSGGEKSRVALAKTLISEANFLLLDEPTNHLDFQSENILIQALQQYEGSFIIVSHNRHFMSQTANKVWYIENYELKEYPGTFEEYEYWKSKKEIPVKPAVTPSPQPQNTIEKEKKKKPKLHKPVDREIKSKIKKAKSEMEKVEVKISDLESEVQTLENKLTDPDVYADVDQLMETNQVYEKIKADLEAANKEWEILALEIDRLER
jgi:ATP-binding cassette subfamily F protein 3